MHKNTYLISHNNYGVAFALLFFLIFLIYSNTFQASWHLDDYKIILNNKHLHLTNLRLESLIQTFFSASDGSLHLGKNLYRPIACLSLALNWYFGQENVFSYHIVNIAIHFSTAFFLFLTILNLLNTPKLRKKYSGSEFFIALLSATLWAINPIQVQGVTYIVQRMASLAAMFYILGLYFYLKGRMSDSLRKRVMLLTACMLSYLFAIGSKENAATLPIAVILMEIIFFQDLSQPKIQKAFIWGIVICGISIIFIGFWLGFRGNFSSLLAGYNIRYFSPLQRLMTGPRILIFYITQIFYPVPSRLSIEHDIAISTSLFNPWTTLPSIIFILMLIGFALSQLRKRPTLAFAMLFFFLNHMIESTIIPLELIFEHRNYLPSLFIFLPVSIGIKWLFDYYRDINRSLYLILVSSMVILVMGFGIGTYIRNMDWATEKTLWEDAMAKAPGKARPYHNLAWGYYKKIGNFDEALRLNKRALNLRDTNPTYAQILSLSNMAAIYYGNKEYEEAIELCKEALDIYPDYLPALHRMALSLLSIGKLEEALNAAHLLLAKNSLNKDYVVLYGFCLLKLDRYAEALRQFRHAFRMSPNDKKILYNIGVTFSLMENFKRADLFLRIARNMSPNSILIIFYLIENSLKAGDQERADQYLEQLFASHSIHNIHSVAKGIPDDSLMLKFSPALLAPVIAQKTEAKIKNTGAN